MTDKSGSAFPCINSDGYNDSFGLTKRELFAAMAMLGLLAQTDDSLGEYEQVAKISVRQADALLVALRKASHD